MGCFPACFGHLRRNVATEKVQHQCFSGSNESVKLLPDKTESHKEEEIASPIKFISESKDKPKEKTNIHISKEEKPVSDYSDVNECANELASTNSDMLLLNKNGEAQKEREKEKEKEQDKDTSEADPENSLKQVHQDFLTNDSECSSVEEDSMSSLFSLSIDSRKQFWGAEMGDKEVSSILKIKNTTSKCDEEKENVPLSNGPTIEQTFDKAKAMKSAAVETETSLSTWLVESEKSPRKMSAGGSPDSEKNYQDRQVLGVIAPPAEVKKLNGFSSVGSTPCCSGDDQLGIGTVGQYWRRRGRIGEVADCRR